LLDNEQAARAINRHLEGSLRAREQRETLGEVMRVLQVEHA
jgi:hypothetical protein